MVSFIEDADRHPFYRTLLDVETIRQCVDVVLETSDSSVCFFFHFFRPTV